MDVIALHQAGFDNAVAALGTAFTTQHAAMMKRYTDNVLVTFDSDGAGVKAALRAIPMLRSAGLSVKVINMRPYKDPDEFIKNLGCEEFQKRIDEAENSFIYEIRRLQETFDLKDPDETARFYNEVALRLLSFEDEVERNIYIDSVCREFIIPKESMEKLVYKRALTYTGRVEENINNNKKRNVNHKDDGVKQSQKILLTWLIDEEQVYDKVKDYISEEDFIEPLYKKVAEMLFVQLRENKINPAMIINYFESEEEQKEAAGLFHAKLDGDMSVQEKEKALNETIMRVKKNSLDYAGRNATDVETLQRIIREKAKLQNMHITLN